MPSLFRYIIHALSGVLVGCSCSVGLIVAVCFDVPIPIPSRLHSECLVCRSECRCMRFKRLRSIIIPLTQNTLKFAVFRECLNGIPKQDRHSGMPSLFRYIIHALSGVLVGCSCSVGLIVAVCFDVPLLSFLCITEITLYYNVLHTHFFYLSFVFFSLSEYLFYNQFMYYTKLHSIT